MVAISKYVVAIHVPIYADGSRHLVSTDWKRSLELLSDSFEGKVGEFVYLAPRLPVRGTADQSLVPLEKDSPWRLRPSFDGTVGPKGYWLGERSRWLSDVRDEMRDASLGHLGMNDLFRPINLDALRIGLGSRAKTVFVRDTDEVLKIRDLLASGVMKPRPYWPAYLAAYERAMRYAVRKADLSLLKGQALFDRYSRYARNPKSFEDTSFSETSVVPMDRLEARNRRLMSGAPLRLVYCGRLEARKGVDRSIRMVEAARAQGAEVIFDIIGDGADRQKLEALVSELQLAPFVTFHGRKDYDADLLRALADYDALLFTPLGEDTPRMIFDGYCAGLPLIGHDIEYVKERKARDGCVVELPRQDLAASAARLAELSARREELARLSLAARQAAFAHTAESWYRRRAAWTLELFDAADPDHGVST